jgi:hypothetical protein
MTKEITLDFIASQLERVLAEQASLRDDARFMTAMVLHELRQQKRAARR